jgi:chromosome segregation ATPase
MSRVPPNLQEKWAFIGNKRFPDQCKWMLNGFWDTLGPDAETIWTWCHSFISLDKQAQIAEKKGAATDLDEFWSHKFLESLGQTMTVIEMREKFRQIDADFNKRMSCIEFLMFRYKLKILDVVNAPQGDNQKEVQQAQAMVEEGQRAVDDMNAKLEASRAAAAAAKAALEEANKKAAQAKKAAEEAKQAAANSKKAAEEAHKTAEAAKKAAEAAWFADQENKKALEELQAQEKAFQGKKAELEGIKADTAIGVVKRNKASNELDQLMAEDPLPLRKAKINQTATVKKSEKASQAAAEAKAKAEADAAAASTAAAAAAVAAKEAEAAAQVAAEAAAAADAAEKQAAQAAAVAEASVKQAEAKLQEALDFLDAAQKKGGIAHGDIWWMQREIAEKKKYLPASKQK